MNYQRIYDTLIQKRKDHRITREECYCEKHHIIPKSLGGSDSLDNLINLTAREHFLAHLLLYRITRDKFGVKSTEFFKMSRAIICMANFVKYGQIKTSRIYEQSKKDFSDSLSWYASKIIVHPKLSEERKAQNKADSSRRRWVSNKELNESHFAKPEDWPWYFEHGFVFGRIIDQSGDKSPIHKHKFSTTECRKRSIRRAKFNKTKPPCKGKIWVNDGHITRIVKPNEIPSGFKIGRLPMFKR